MYRLLCSVDEQIDRWIDGWANRKPLSALKNGFACALAGYLSPRGVLRCFLTHKFVRRDGTAELSES